MGLKHALSSKVLSGDFVVLDAATSEDHKTKSLREKLAKLGWRRALVIDGPEVDQNFLRASSNIEEIDILPSQGANVYDILKKDTLVVTKAGVEGLMARFAPQPAGEAVPAAAAEKAADRRLVKKNARKAAKTGGAKEASA